MIAMRYGAVPVVTPTGGLLDTVHDGQNGFVASQVNAGAFLSSVHTAIEKWNEPEAWSMIQERGMKQDFAWRNSVGEYLMLYESVLK
jgi:starch synthase